MRHITIAFLLISVLLLSACGQNPEDARKELGQMNIPYSERSFIEAADNGDILAVKLFLHAGMNVNATIGYETALSRAIQSKRTEIIKLLLDNGANPNATGGTPFENAVTQGSVELVELLLDKGANPNIGHSLGNAVQNENIEITELLLDKGADINAAPVLEIAAQKGNNELAKVLVEHGVDVNIQNGEPLRIALQANNYNLAEFLLNNGANPNITDYNKNPILFKLAEKANTSLVSLLLNKGANVNATDDYKTTALMLAVGAGHIDTTKLLLDKGADINARQDIDGMQISSYKDNVTGNEYVLQVRGKTALLRAISSNNPEMLKLVLSRITDINANGGEAFLYAADRGINSVSPDYSNIVKILIDNKADVNVKDKDGKTPLQIARSKFGNGLTCYDQSICKTIELLKAAGEGKVTESAPQQPKSLNALGSKTLTPSETQTKADHSPQQNEEINTPNVAIVNGEYITKATLEALEKEIAERSHGQTFPKEKLIEELIARELLAQDAIQKQLDKSPEFMVQLDSTKKALLTQAVLQNYIKANPVTDEEIKAEYDSKVAAKKGTEYKARHILVKTEAEAKKLIAELDKGADFAKLANQYSLDAKESQNGGDLGWFTAAQMVAPFSEAVAKLEKGKYTKEPVKTQFGYHVIFKEDERPVTPPPLEAVKEQLTPYMQRKKVQGMIEDLRKQAEIEISDKTDAVAVVNGKYISKKALADLESEIAERSHGQTSPKEKLIEELIQRELLVQEAMKKGLDKSPEFKAQLESAKKALLTQADLQNFIKANPGKNAQNMVETLRKQAIVEILVPLTSSESKPTVTRKPLRHPDQEVKVQTEDQQTIQFSQTNNTLANNYTDSKQSNSSESSPSIMVMRMLEYAMNDGGLSYESQIQQTKLQIEGLPKPTKGDKKTARRINDEALLLFNNNGFESAAKKLIEANRIDPSDVEIINNLGYSYLKQGNLDLAQQSLITALTMSPGRSNAWSNLGDVFAIKGDISRAVACFSNAYRFSKNRVKTIQLMKELNEKEDVASLKQARSIFIDWAEKPHPDIN